MFILVPLQYKTPHHDSRGLAVWRYFEVLGKFFSEAILFEFSIPGVHPPSNGKDS